MKIKAILGESININEFGNNYDGPDDDDYEELSDGDLEDSLEDYLEYLFTNSSNPNSDITSPLKVVEEFGDKWKYGTEFMNDFYDKIAAVPELKKKFGGLHPLEETAVFKFDIEDFTNMFKKSPVKALSRYAFNFESIENEKGSKLYDDILTNMKKAHNDGAFEVKTSGYEPDYESMRDARRERDDADLR
tara:strand:+ start:1337 stop:1906 length:570 start_codon:yes stop_codon:yes gene_type:complete